MKLIIAGGRDFADYEKLEQQVRRIINGHEKIEIVSGCCNTGADALGEKLARKNGWPVKRFPAEWDKYGKSAGPIRNSEMAAYADHCICFWDGISRGTKDMLDKARTAAVFTIEVRY